MILTRFADAIVAGLLSLAMAARLFALGLTRLRSADRAGLRRVRGDALVLRPEATRYRLCRSLGLVADE